MSISAIVRHPTTSAPAPLRSWLEAPLLVNVPLNDPPRVTDAFLRLTRQFQLREGLHAIRLKSDFLGFLAELHENIGVNGTNDGRAWRKALDYIYRHYAESDLTLTAIARAAALSTSQLCRVFRAECGTTPMKYLTKVRVARASDLLRKLDADLPVARPESPKPESPHHESPTHDRPTAP